MCACGICQENKETIYEAQHDLQQAQDDYDRAQAASVDAEEPEHVWEVADQAGEAAEQAQGTFKNIRSWDIVLSIIVAIVSFFVFVMFFTVYRKNFENMWKDVKDIEDKSVEVKM